MTKHLIIAEVQDGKLHNSTLTTLGAASKIEGPITALIMGASSNEAATVLKDYAAKTIFVNSSALNDRLAQPYAKVIAEVATQEGATHVWHGATVAGKDIMPRVAARLDAGMASDIQEVIDGSTFKRPMWAGNIIGTVEVTSPIKVITVRPTEFDKAVGGVGGELVEANIDAGDSSMRFVSFDAVKSDRPALGDARVVISGGRGLKGPEGFKEIVEPLADKLSAAIGASRAVCDAGWVPNDWQVGQTGKVVAPELYIAVGLSGAIQHVAGMKGSKCIVAINTDEEAPIFQVADYGIVADAFKAVPELLEKI